MEKSSTWSHEKLNEHIKANARSMRKLPTKAEKLLWDCLRNRKLNGVKFRRQQPMFRFILDFYCEQHKLCIEVDGGIHLTLEQARYDKSRDEYLLEHGIQTIRFRNDEVEENLDEVLERIGLHCKETP